MTIHSEDLREKVARIIRSKVRGATYQGPLGNGTMTSFPGLGVVGADEAAGEILSLISSIKEGGGEVLSSVGSGLTPLVPSRVPEPGPATPSLVGQSDIHYITAALSWYDGSPAGADVQSAWRRIRDACGYTGAPDESSHHAPDTREGSKAEGHGRPNQKPSHKDSQ